MSKHIEALLYSASGHQRSHGACQAGKQNTLTRFKEWIWGTGLNYFLEVCHNDIFVMRLSTIKFSKCKDPLAFLYEFCEFRFPISRWGAGFIPKFSVCVCILKYAVSFLMSAIKHWSSNNVIISPNFVIFVAACHPYLTMEA